MLEDEPNTLLDETDEPDVLDCDHSRAFWMTWSNNSLALGRGMPKTEMVLVSLPGANATLPRMSNLTSFSYEKKIIEKI